nr:unnamed protein product [Leishmania braziliensis]
MLDVSCESILFDEVAVNDIPTYRPVQVRNTTESPLLVQFTTTSPVVQFQLRNENYEAIKRTGFADTLSVYNEAFDLVGLISSVELAPFEEKDLIVWFRANTTTFSHLVKGSQPVPYTGSLQLTVVDLALAPPLGNAPSKGGENRVVEQQSAAACIAIPFRANVYISCLELSSTELNITMAPNKTQVADFVVTNTSCQPVYFVIRDQAMPLRGLDVALYESDKFEEPKLGHRLLLDSYSYMTFSLMLRSSMASSTAQQQYHAVFQCDNLRDSRNTAFLYVSVNVVAESQGDLVAFHDTSVNFGDVYRGTKATAIIHIESLDRVEAVLRLGDVDRRKCEGRVSLMKDDVAVDELAVGSKKGNQLNTVTLMYQPSYDGESNDASKIKFDVELFVVPADRRHSQRVVIRCAAALYTSNIVVSQRCVNFGDCQVGQSKRYTLQIENRSPLPGKIVMQLRSKIIRIEGASIPQKLAGRELKEEFSVAPSASLPITLRITPQRVNAMYRKQLTIINASNPAEDRQVINIEANNMAPLDAKLHDELYSWKCDLGNIDSTDSRRGPSTLLAISGVPLIVPYSVQSKADHEVVLNLRSSCSEIEVFYSSDAVVCEQLGKIAAEMRSFCVYGESEDASHLTNDSAGRLFAAREELLRLLNETSHNITNRITLEPSMSLKVYVLIIRTTSPTEPLTKEDGISIAVDGIEAPRFVRLSYRLCGTSFELNGQKTKNFGEVNIGVKKTTKLPIVNRCNSFLYLHLSKSRSVTAEHIRMENSDKRSIFLTIRPYASREIELTLYPGIKGVFQENIRVSNILNIKNTITMTLKATVTKADTFEISPDSWTFEMMVPPSSSVPALMASSPSLWKADEAAAAANARVGAKFTVSNTSNGRRQIVVRLELNSTTAANGVSAANPYLSFAGVKVAVQLDMGLSGAGSVSTRKLEEQIEKLEQKLKIYVRKKKTEKAENAMRKIEAYRLALKGEEVDLAALETAQSTMQGTTDHELSESEDDGSAAALQAWRSKTQQGDIVQLLRREGVALPSMDIGESVIITLFLGCKRVLDEPIPMTQTQTINMLFYEERDQEANRIIPIDLILISTPGDATGRQLLAAPFVAAAPQTMLASALSASAVVAPSASLSLPSPSHRGSELLQLSTENAAAASASGGALHSGSSLPGSSGTASRAVQSRPLPRIRLITTGSQTGNVGGRFHSTFMGHPLLVLHNCIVNDPTEFSFVVKASAKTTIVVLEPRRCGGSIAAVLDARFKLFPRNGHVRQQEPLRIVVECTARSVGPQKYFIPVKNICNPADVQYLTVEMNPTEEIEMLTTEPKELLFRDVITPCAVSQLEAQLVLIRCRFSFPHALVVRTNRPSQLALFEDASCTVPLLHPIRHIFVKETVRVYVQLRPGARYVDPCARQIRAGVLVEAVAPNPAVSSAAFCVVGKAIVRAMACVGSGLIEVLQGNLDLGCVASTQDFVKTHFTVRNTSHTFSLRVALVPSSPLLEVAEETSAANEIALGPLQEHMVPILVHLPAPGLTREFIDVVNRSSAQEKMRVSLSALRMNDGIVQLDPSINTRLVFPVAAVVRGEQGKQLHLHQPVSYSVKLANYHTHREMVLATTAAVHASCELPLWFHTPDEESKVRAAFEEEQRQALEVTDDAATPTPVADQPPAMYMRGRVELRANHTQTVTWTLTSLPMLTSAEVTAVLQHQMVAITTTLQVCVTYTAHSARAGAAAGGWQGYSSRAAPQGSRYRGPTVGQCVLLVPIMLSLAMSEGRAEPALVNLGLVGKATSMLTSPISVASSVSSTGEEHDAALEQGDDAFAGGREEEMAFAMRQRRRRRSRISKLQRLRDHTFSAYVSKSGLQQPSSHNMVVSFRLMNLSSVMPLPLKVECPPVVRFSQTRLTIPPGESAVVEAALSMKLIATQGTFRYEAFFVNEWNPENDMAVCITGQHYWKVFQVLRADTQEEVHESLTLAPLRVEPSLRGPLAEMKLTFVATEPDVELDLHLQPNPQLDGLLELLLLHYDATSVVRHLNFRTDAVAPLSSGTTSAAGGSAAISVGQGNASPAAAALASHATSGAATPGSGSAIAVMVAGAGAGLGGGSAASGSASTSVGLPGGGMPVSLQSGTTSGVAATAAVIGLSTLGATSATLPADESCGAAATILAGTAGGAPAAVTATSGPAGSSSGSSGVLKAAGSVATKTKPRKMGTSTAPGTAASANSGAGAATTRSQTLRLRCLLRGADLTSLVSLFYGHRKARTAGASAQVTAATAARGTGAGAATTGLTAVAMPAPVDITALEAPGASSSTNTVSWTYDRIAGLERRSASLESNNVWLGTFVMENPFTEAEEVQVYGKLAPFRTFSAPPKVMLRPCRVSVESVPCPGASATAPQAFASRSTPQVGYVGEISITNEFDVYVAELSVVVLVHEHLAVPLCIDVRGGYRNAVDTTSPGSVAGAAPFVSEVVRENEAATVTDLGAAAILGATPRPGVPVSTSFLAAPSADGAAPVSLPHRIHLGPYETVVVTVVIRPADVRALGLIPMPPTTAASSAPPLSLSLPSLEQFVSVALVDENAPFSYAVSRVSVVTPTSGSEALPSIVLSSVITSDTATAATSVAAASDASTKDEEAEGRRCATLPPIAQRDDSTGQLVTTLATLVDERLSTVLPTPTVLDETPQYVSLSSGKQVSNLVLTSGTSAAASAADAGSSGAEVLPLRGSTSCGSEDTADGPVPLGGILTTLAPSLAAATRQWVLSLRNCDALPGCGGAYLFNFSVPRDDPYEPNILITNHAPDRAVRYTAQVISQSPQVWLLLTSTTGVLEAGETQLLRLQVLSSEVGSFIGYVAITNAYDAREVVYLRLNAEVFVPGTAEGFFDVVAMNSGHRLATTNAGHTVNMGALYGAGTSRALIALEIVNKGSVALEFPVSVVHPMRQELRPIPQGALYSTAAATASGHRRRDAAAGVLSQRTKLFDGSSTTLLASPPSSRAGLDQQADPTAVGAATDTLAAAQKGAIDGAVLTTAGGAEALLTTQPFVLEKTLPSPHHTRRHYHRRGVRAGSGVAAAPTSTSLSSTVNTSAAPFEGKLIVCQIHGVPTRTGQRYFVVDPRSRMRLAFVLSCNALYDIPEGYGVFGQTDVVFRCKQARDARFSFNVNFEAHRPTFAVAHEYDMDAAERAVASAAAGAALKSEAVGSSATASGPFDGDASSKASAAPSLASPPPASTATSRWAEVEVSVMNLSRNHAQVFVLYTQSEVLSLSVPGAGPLAHSGCAGSALLPPLPGAAAEDDGYSVVAAAGNSGGLAFAPSGVELTVGPQSAGIFAVRLDRLRAEALLKFDKDESMLARPALCEHAFLYNKGNPRERVQLLFRQQALLAHPRRQGRSAAAASSAVAPLPSTLTDAKPVKSDGQHFSERHILGFAQRFSAVMTSLADRVPFLTQPESVVDAVRSHKGVTNSHSVGTSGGGGGSGVASIIGGEGADSVASVTSAGAAAIRVSAGTAASTVGGIPGSVVSSAFNTAHRSAGRHQRGRRARDSGRVAHRGNTHRSGQRDSFRDDTSDDGTASSSSGTTSTTSTSSNDVDSIDDVASEIAEVAADRMLESMLMEDNFDQPSRDGCNDANDIALGEVIRESSESIVAGCTTDVHSSSDGAPGGLTPYVPLSSSSHPRTRGSAPSTGTVVASCLPSSLPSGTSVAHSNSGGSHLSNEDSHWYDTLITLQDLLVELTWLCDELLFYAILLRNSRHVEASGAFLVSAVAQHPVMVAWRRHRGSSSHARKYGIFGQFLETLDALPRLSSSFSPSAP